MKKNSSRWNVIYITSQAAAAVTSLLIRASLDQKSLV